MAKRKIVNIDEERCTGCGECVPNCAEGALQIINGKAKLVKDIYCDGLGACLGHCPEDAITIEERDVNSFDEEATKKHLEEVKKKEAKKLPCGCPGTQVKSLNPKGARGAECKVKREKRGSELINWPVQLKLVPVDAPYLKNSDLLITLKYVCQSQ